MIAGIAWIGTSFYFVALDFSLRKREGLPSGVSGEAWEVHGGGFYNVQKYLSRLPSCRRSHLVQMGGLSHLGHRLPPAHRAVLSQCQHLSDFPGCVVLTPWQAIGISVASLIAGWIIYDLMCRSALVRKPELLALCVSSAYSCRGLWLYPGVFREGRVDHVGAFIGTIMAANVFMVIIPNQRKSPRRCCAAKTRSKLWHHRQAAFAA